MDFYHFAFVLFADLVRLYERDIAVRTVDIGEFLVVVHLNGTFSVQDVEVGGDATKAFLTSLINNTEDGLSIFIESLIAAGAPAIEIGIVLNI